jgi:transcriptional regulator with XRE-family HTH domain
VSRRSSTSPVGEDEGWLTPVDRRRKALGAWLREHRHWIGSTQAQLARDLGISEQMVSHYEVGRYSPTPDMVRRLVIALGLHREAEAELRDKVAELAVEVSTFRVVHRQGGERAMQAAIASREHAAKVIWDYQDEIVQGLLQTPDYTRAMVPLLAPDLPDLDELVAGRLERQSVLYDRTKSFRFLLHEAALRARVAPPVVLRAQLDRLRSIVAALPYVEIRVLPFSIPLDAWVMTSFRLVDDQVEVELQTDVVTYRDPRDVATYREVFGRLWQRAASGDELLAVLREVDSWLASLPE